jgi:ABC-type transport system involved in cytochrome c biogenesis permease subunit
MVLGLLLEKVYRVGIGSVVASLAGFVTLMIAHNLALGGDTMEMLRAVLDTNFWLATHVVVITLGYASTFAAGLLAILYIFVGVFTPLLTQKVGAGRSSPSSDPQPAASGSESVRASKTLPASPAIPNRQGPAKMQAAVASHSKIESQESPIVLGEALTTMVYAIVCFATLFSFVGTVLGGIWADQSWGRFWGWDPKENGALLIVIWNAVILHARWGNLVGNRGLMNLAVFGNIVTSFSWFGVNMLGIGLHSYGFMDAAFYWLMIFIASQLVVIAIGFLPLSLWRSFRVTAKFPTPGVPAPAGA